MKVFDKAIESRLDRQRTFIAFGGGVIGVMCRYVAASFLRGFYVIQIPTTVMEQVDYLVGGKSRELASGFAEVIKYGLIRDVEFFEWQEKNMKAYPRTCVAPIYIDSVVSAWGVGALAYAIKRSCENKAEVVFLDEKESGLRATLNLGHTFGHNPLTKRHTPPKLCERKEE
ncbi:hypothetical protein RHSIM_Rhsim07G0143100 [Rhododendron simsii]|uniref:3-dehydroquinate synthase domain-containing protein n=1 Tax=Rhododendron simsii TaxID=118357 RepID=A0A834GM52_RHOSS|nr:hypothetical protein RHSIM_Rhsim07G0143100 [Rhododendron simsii]